MSLFTQHQVETAPAGASEVLAKVVDRYGFIPNLASFVAESPVTLDAIMRLSSSFDKSTLAPQEQQIVLLTVSALNGCSYCKTVHTALGRMAELDRNILQAALALENLPESRLNALAHFTREVVEHRGWLHDEAVQRFLNAGYTRAQVFEVVMGVALKILTNYSNHLAGAQPNEQFIAMAEG